MLLLIHVVCYISFFSPEANNTTFYMFASVFCVIIASSPICSFFTSADLISLHSSGHHHLHLPHSTPLLQSGLTAHLPCCTVIIQGFPSLAAWVCSSVSTQALLMAEERQLVPLASETTSWCCIASFFEVTCFSWNECFVLLQLHECPSLSTVLLSAVSVPCSKLQYENIEWKISEINNW